MQTLINYDELPEIVRSFTNYKLTVQGRSKRTADEYALDLRTFLRYITAKRGGILSEMECAEDFEKVDISGVDLAFVSSVTTEEIYDFLYYTLDARGNKWSARARKLSALRSFYKYLTVSMRLFDNNPVKDIETPQRKKTLPKVMTLDESMELLEAVRSDETSKTVERDYCMIVLFLNCGMRLSELVGINITDIDRSFESFRVVGKGSKERIIYLNDACQSAIKAYLRVRNTDEVQIKDRNALFLSSRHSRISNKTVQFVVYKYLKLAGLEHKKFSTHKLRHTAATLMYQSGNVDVRVLKDILGHEQLNTTQIYTHVSDEHMKKAMSQNPLASFKATGAKAAAFDDEDDE